MTRVVTTKLVQLGVNLALSPERGLSVRLLFYIQDKPTETLDLQLIVEEFLGQKTHSVTFKQTGDLCNYQLSVARTSC